MGWRIIDRVRRPNLWYRFRPAAAPEGGTGGRRDKRPSGQRSAAHKKIKVALKPRAERTACSRPHFRTSARLRGPASIEVLRHQGWPLQARLEVNSPLWSLRSRNWRQGWSTTVERER